jgi:hypothetical protein
MPFAKTPTFVSALAFKYLAGCIRIVLSWLDLTLWKVFVGGNNQLNQTKQSAYCSTHVNKNFETNYSMHDYVCIIYI